MKVIEYPHNSIAIIKKELCAQYVVFLKEELQMNENLLADPKWAKSGSHYHNQCLKEKAAEIKNIQTQLKLLHNHDTSN